MVIIGLYNSKKPVIFDFNFNLDSDKFNTENKHQFKDKNYYNRLQILQISFENDKSITDINKFNKIPNIVFHCAAIREKKNILIAKIILLSWQKKKKRNC